MRILLIHQYFKTPEQGGGVRSYHVAKALAKSGHEVQVITAHGKAACHKEIEGVDVIYLKVPYSNHFGFLRRVFAFLKFYQSVLKAIKGLPKADVVYAISTPLSVGWLGKSVSEKWKAKFIFEVGDLWPEVPIQMGIVRNGQLKNWLYKVEKSIYDAADTVIALSPDIAEYIEGKTRSQVFVVPNMADVDFFQPTDNVDEINFRIGYFGTIGKANELEYLIDFAEKAEHQQLKVEFVIMGDGARKKAIVEKVRRKGISNLSIEQWSGMQDVRKQLERCEAVFISFKNIPILHSGCPNKFFDGLAAGKIIISNLTGWTKNVIELNNIGFTYNPDHPEEGIQQLKILLGDQEKIHQNKAQSRQLALTEYSVASLTNKVINLLD